MERPEVNVVSLGRILEGRGKIRSSLEDNGLDGFGEKLRMSLARVEQPACLACGDGRLCLHQADGGPARVRARIFGASTAPLVMVGMADPEFIKSSTPIKSQADLRAVISRLHERLGNEESGHIDCGAATGMTSHVRSVAELTSDDPNLAVALSILEKELPGEDVRAIARDIIIQAKDMAQLLEQVSWDGPAYVDDVAKKAAANVEVLATKDDGVGGHAEAALVLVEGPVDEDGHALYTIDEQKLMDETGHQAFVVNLEEFRRTAKKLGDYGHNLTALVLHQICGVYANLADGSHPVYVVGVS